MILSAREISKRYRFGSFEWRKAMLKRAQSLIHAKKPLTGADIALFQTEMGQRERSNNPLTKSEAFVQQDSDGSWRPYWLFSDETMLTMIGYASNGLPTRAAAIAYARREGAEKVYWEVVTKGRREYRESRKNPLTKSEAADSLLEARDRLYYARRALRPRDKHFRSGEAQGISRVVMKHGPRKGGVKGSLSIMHQARKLRDNPAEKRVQIGRQVLAIKTTRGTLNPRSKASLWGLPDGSIFIRGFFTSIPAGPVLQIDYRDEAKAKREGLSPASRPWRHDFSSERCSLARTRGGLLIQAKKKPLWGYR